ncbi:MAG: hypothetical protein ACRDBG_07890, partial [Waterburya sp.]
GNLSLEGITGVCTPNQDKDWEIFYSIPVSSKTAIKYKQAINSQWIYRAVSNPECKNLTFKVERKRCAELRVFGTAKNVLGNTINWSCIVDEDIERDFSNFGFHPWGGVWLIRWDYFWNNFYILRKNPNGGNFYPHAAEGNVVTLITRGCAAGTTPNLEYSGLYIDNPTDYPRGLYNGNNLKIRGSASFSPYTPFVPSETWEKQTMVTDLSSIKVIDYVTRVVYSNTNKYLVNLYLDGYLSQNFELDYNPIVSLVEDGYPLENQDRIVITREQRKKIFKKEIEDRKHLDYFISLNIDSYVNNDDFLCTRIVLLIFFYSKNIFADAIKRALIFPYYIYRLATAVKTYEFLNLCSPICSQKHPKVCWNCNYLSDKCPIGTCFKCLNKKINKICCYGKGGKFLKAVSTLDEKPDC